MDMSSMTSSAMSSSATGMVMEAVFTTSTNTPIYSSAWTPSSTAAYAFTCIFFIFLSIFARGLLAAKSILEARWKRQDLARPYIVTPDLDSSYRDEESKVGASEDVRRVDSMEAARRGMSSRPWRLSVDLPRALLVTVSVGVGYLLMLAVMSMNVGYFLSILAGAFLGELFVGRYAQVSGPRKEY